MARGKIIDSFQISPEQRLTCLKRVTPLMRHWGRFCDSASLDILAISCYSQGMIDGVQVAEKQFGAKIPEELRPIDFQI